MSDYYEYYSKIHKAEKQTKEMFEYLRECQKELSWPDFKSNDQLLLYAKMKGVISESEKEMTIDNLRILGK